MMTQECQIIIKVHLYANPNYDITFSHSLILSLSLFILIYGGTCVWTS